MNEITSVVFLLQVVDDFFGGDGRRRRRGIEETQIEVGGRVKGHFGLLVTRITGQRPTQRPTQRPPNRLLNFENVHFCTTNSVPIDLTTTKMQKKKPVVRFQLN